MTRLAATLVLLGSLLLTGCTGGNGGDGVLTVLAAASLTDALDGVAADFEDQHPGVDVRVVTGSSTTLAEQAADGAPGDVLATADEQSMSLAAAVQASDPVVFAVNELVLVVPRGNPGDVSGIVDLAGSRWVRCADTVPCGRLAREALRGQAAGPRSAPPEPASLEVDVRAVLAKVVAGEADAGLVYASDAHAASPHVEVVEVPGAGPGRGSPHVTHYLAAPLAQAGDAEQAGAFVRHLGSREGQQALVEAGFSVRRAG